MSDEPKKPFYITTAIAYTSGKPHIGNLYEIVLADAIARFMRFSGYDVYFQTGTDEHGQKIQDKAEAAGMDPQAFVDMISGEIRRNWDVMNISYDRFIRTTDPDHMAKIQKIFKRYYEQGDIYKGMYEGWYCKPDESFYTESQLIDGKCPDCGRPVEYAKEEAYFFKLSNYAKRLEEYIESHPDFIQPESRKNEMLNNFIRPGLKDLCVSRTSFNWGIPVDFDPGHVVYVWIDALANYITFPGYNPDGDDEPSFKKYWPADLHLVGKDIIRFHTIYWPIMLMALDLPLPKKVFGHPWLLVGGGKMSKSKGNVIYADDLVHSFGLDAIRYYCLKEMPFAQDGNLTYDLIIDRVNGELVNILGNLVNRTMAMTNQYFDGVIPAKCIDEAMDSDLINEASTLFDRVSEKMADLRISDSMQLILDLFRRANKYVDETQPWVLAKDPDKRERLGGVLYNLLEVIRISACLIRCYLPDTGDKMLKMLSCSDNSMESCLSFGLLVPGTKLGASEKLFERIDPVKQMVAVEEYLANKPKSAAEAANVIAAAPATEETNENPPDEGSYITVDDFGKVELKVGKIISAEKHPDADKLLILKVDTGEKIRTIVSGIAKYYKPEEITGKTVTVVANLKPAKLRGILSEGMILMAEHDGKLSFVASSDDIPAGGSVR